MLQNRKLIELRNYEVLFKKQLSFDESRGSILANKMFIHLGWDPLNDRWKDATWQDDS